MKIVSKATAVAALLLGIGVFMHSTTAQAMAPCGSPACTQWWAECEQGNQSACNEFRGLCSGCPPRATVSGTPPVNSHGKSDMALLNSKQPISVAK